MQGINNRDKGVNRDKEVIRDQGGDGVKENVALPVTDTVPGPGSYTVEVLHLHKPLPDIIADGLRVLFIGYNPGLRSAELGHHYAGRSNRFWEILFRSGLTPEKLSYLRDRELLTYGFGSTNIVDRPSKGADELTGEEYQLGRVNLQALLEEIKPAVACYVGSGVYRAFAGKAKTNWGRQQEQTVAGITDFIAPSTSGLNRMPIAQQVEIYRDLKEILEQA